MHRHLSLPEICRVTKELGYDYIELSPRPDFMVWWTRPRTYPEAIRSFKKAMQEHDVGLATMQPMYRWASLGPINRELPPLNYDDVVPEQRRFVQRLSPLPGR